MFLIHRRKLLKILKLCSVPLISLMFLVLYLLGVLNIYFNDKNDYCQMTYMFEYPQFVRISVPENQHYPQYGLYVYSEGRLTEKARKMWFDGIPVLFLPGNSGSHMQVRSLASVALRKSLSNGYDLHFDFFTIDYNGEIFGLYGGGLEGQTDFAASCISRILSLYKTTRYKKSVPSSVVLIGHSMGGMIVKNLMAQAATINVTFVAFALATPLEAPVINFDSHIDKYYIKTENDWESNINSYEDVRKRKFLISIGNGPRDVLVPPGLASSQASHLSVLTTAIPGVWLSPDHLSVVWCKQLVMTIVRFLFSIADAKTEQIVDDQHIIIEKAKNYFEANRYMYFEKDTILTNATMAPNAFWYEDNRRKYQISRPDLQRDTYLMIRLVDMPVNRFVAIESINLEDKDWLYGCNAKYVEDTYRYCKNGSSLTRFSRWTAAANDFGKRKVATINLHSLMKSNPDWTHVLVKMSPTRKPIVLNVDINDYVSRQITVDLPSIFSMKQTKILSETEPHSLYYELILPGFDQIHQAYLLHIEPTIGCSASQYHVSAEVHIPWAKNNEYFHFFTHIKRSPMKLRLFKSKPPSESSLDQHIKITILLDPQCTFAISISSSWYQRLAQIVRHYTPILIPYSAAIILLAARSSFIDFQNSGSFLSMNRALLSDGVRPYYALAVAKVGFFMITYVPSLSIPFMSASWKNLELHYFSSSCIAILVYMVALALLQLIGLLVTTGLVFYSQLAHRMLFRVVWRGGGSIAENISSGLQRFPLVVSVGLVLTVPISCGAASLLAGVAFHAFLISKLYEEYLEDYVYKLLAKVAAKMCRLFKTKTNENLMKKDENINIDNSTVNDSSDTIKDIKCDESKTAKNTLALPENSDLVSGETIESSQNEIITCQNEVEDDKMNSINFHVMLFFFWIVILFINVPALLTWARNFKYIATLKPDTSYYTGLIISVCSTCIWQMELPREKLKHYDVTANLLFIMAVLVLMFGPFSLSFVNNVMVIMFLIITLQQLFDFEDISVEVIKRPPSPGNEIRNEIDEDCKDDTGQAYTESESSSVTNMCDECSESRIYNAFKRIKEKLSFNES